MFSLSGRVAVVTGGNGGIGLGIARGLAKAGAQVVVAARNAGKSDAAVLEIRSAGHLALSISVDVTDSASVQALADQTMARCGRLDILVNNAGVEHPKTSAGAFARGMAEGPGYEPHERVSLLAELLPEHAEGRRGEDHQHRIRGVAVRSLLCLRLRRQQGRHRSADPIACGRMGRRQHPGQCHSARLDRHGATARRPGARSAV